MNSDYQTIIDALPWVIPLIILELVLLVIAVVDIVRREYVTGGNKVVWLIVVIIINFIGPIIYFIFGRREKPLDGDQD
jgi:hypothetical protein